MAHKQYSNITYLNTLRSAIASVFKQLHPTQVPIALQPLTQEFFQAKRKQPVPVRPDHKLTTWDIDIVLQFLMTRMGQNQSITLAELQKKTIVLTCIATMARPRSDVGKEHTT